MALVIKDRVKETTTTTGTGTFNLAGAVSGFEGFIQVGDGNTVYYVCTDNTSFEIGIGTFTDASPDTLSRDTILQAKDVPNGTTDQKVDWGSGTRTIFCTYPADKAVFKDASNNINGTFVGNITGDVTGNADTATTLETAREINGTSFNGGANITVTAAAGTLTGNTLNSGVTASSLTSLGTLASNLNLGGQDIVTTTSNQDIDLQTHGTGVVVIKGNNDDSGSNVGAIKFNCEVNSHGQILKAAPHSASADNVLILPQGQNDSSPQELVAVDITQTLTNKTLTSPKINEDVAVTSTATELNILDGVTSTTAELNILDGVTATASELNILDGKSFVDEDNMASDSATAIASQQSIKAYVDAQKADMQFVLEDGDGTEVQITKDKEVKFVEGGGLDINWTDTSTGSDADPYDLTFTVNASQTGITSLTNASLVIGRDADNDIDFSTDNQITFRANGADQIKLTDGALVPVTNNDVDLGTSSLEFKDAFFDGTVTADAFAGPLTGNADTATKVYVDESEDDNAAYNIAFLDTVEGGNGFRTMQVDNTGLTFNPGTNTLAVTNTSTTLATAAQPNITSLGTLTTLTVDNVIVNGTTIGHTDDTDLMTVADGVLTVAGEVSMTTLDIGGTNVTATATELNIMDGVTATTSELNIMDGVTSTTSELNILDGVTATASELNIMDGVTSTTAELNILDGVTATASELNIMDGVTATTAELNHSDGVTSNIQTQLDAKATKGFVTAMAIAL